MMSIRSQSKWCCMWKKNWYVIYSNFDIITLVAVEALGPATSRVRRAERERAGRGWVLGVGYPAGPHPRGAHSVPHKLRLWTLSHTQCSVAANWPNWTLQAPTFLIGCLTSEPLRPFGRSRSCPNRSRNQPATIDTLPTTVVIWQQYHTVSVQTIHPCPCIQVSLYDIKSNQYKIIMYCAPLRSVTLKEIRRPSFEWLSFYRILEKIHSARSSFLSSITVLDKLQRRKIDKLWFA